MISRNYMNANLDATQSTTERYYIERMALIEEDFINVILMLAIISTGQYVGTTLNKPTKPQ